ncbi:MAG: hypothetical protein E6J90_38680 [Deltaproteobacteria bacterium]|nr:MAG: hypothetical protein E6J90_38680 [Deltaproteobacteria bacterium]
MAVAWLVVCAMPVSAAPISSPASLSDKYKLTDPEAIMHFQAGNAAYHTVSERQTLADRADARRRSALVVGIGSGALLASGALILMLWSGRDPAPTRIGWNFGITGHGVAVSGRF